PGDGAGGGVGHALVGGEGNGRGAGAAVDGQRAGGGDGDVAVEIRRDCRGVHIHDVACVVGEAQVGVGVREGDCRAAIKRDCAGAAGAAGVDDVRAVSAGRAE